MKVWKRKIIDGLELIKEGCEEALEDDLYNCFNCPWVYGCMTLQTDVSEFAEPRHYRVDELREDYLEV